MLLGLATGLAFAVRPAGAAPGSTARRRRVVRRSARTATVVLDLPGQRAPLGRLRWPSSTRHLAWPHITGASSQAASGENAGHDGAAG